MNIGNLYTVKKYFWLLFPTKETAAAIGTRLVEVIFHLDANAATAGALVVVADAAAWYSKRYNCEVTYFPLDSIVVFLEEDGKLKKVLTSEGLIGWTWFDESYNDCFEEVKSE